MTPDKRQILLHRLALVTATATFPLIFMGGLVTSHGAGMSVPDWPNTWGYNLFAFPYSHWVGGIWYEHTHRLAAATIGMLTILIMAVAFYAGRFRWTAVALFAACLAQGILGGLRVVLNELDLAIVHGCAAQVFFCFAATYCVLTSSFWSNHRMLQGADHITGRRILNVSIFTVAAIFLQLIVGAIMRHSGAGLAIPDFPTSYGKILPPLAIDGNFREAAIHQYGLGLNLNRVTLFQIWIAFAHRMGALLVTCMILWLSISILRNLRRESALTRPAILLLILLATQLTLGILTVLLRKPADIASLHVAVGSLVLVTAWVTVVRTFGLVKIVRPVTESHVELAMAATA